MQVDFPPLPPEIPEIYKEFLEGEDCAWIFSSFSDVPMFWEGAEMPESEWESDSEMEEDSQSSVFEEDRGWESAYPADLASHRFLINPMTRLSTVTQKASPISQPYP